MVINMGDTKALRAAFSQSPTSVAVITTFDGQRKRGFTISSFISLSLDPPLCLYALEKNAKRRDMLLSAEHFIINVLSKGQSNVARAFSKGDDESVWSTVPNEKSDALGLPVISGCVTIFECSAHNQFDGGDHIIVVGKIQSYKTNGGDPLLFHGAGVFSTIVR